jgi:hypothetical protein
MSPDHTVVWLTSQPDVSLTERDARAMAPLSELQRMRAGEIETFEARPCKRWRYGTMGERLHMVINGQKRTVAFVGDTDNLVRVAIDISEDDANLSRYITWPNRPKMRGRRAFYQLDHVRLWYVYLARIAPIAITEIREMSRW